MGTITRKEAQQNCANALAEAQAALTVKNPPEVQQIMCDSWCAIAYEWRQLAEDLKGEK